MTHAKKNFVNKSKRMMDDSSEVIDRKGRASEKSVDLNRTSSAKQPASSKDKLGRRDASRK